MTNDVRALKDIFDRMFGTPSHSHEVAWPSNRTSYGTAGPTAEAKIEKLGGNYGGRAP